MQRQRNLFLIKSVCQGKNLILWKHEFLGPQFHSCGHSRGEHRATMASAASRANWCARVCHHNNPQPNPLTELHKKEIQRN